MSTAIIIAGMHRSGTSATTGGLTLAGVSLGAGLLEAAADNPKGYFENERAVQIHEKLLNDLGMSWDDVRELPSDWMATVAASEARASIHALIDKEFADQSIWALKDPRICRFIPLWRDVLSVAGIKVVALHVVRRPDEVAASISARNGWSRHLGELLWMRHVFEAEAATRDVPRTVLTYESLLEDPLASLLAAMERVGVVLDVPPTAAEELSAFVDNKDRHHVHDEVGEGDGFSVVMDAAYQALAAIEHGSGDWRAVQQAGEQAGKWLKEPWPYIDAVAAKAARHRSEALGMEVRSFELQSALNAQNRWSEEAVAREQRLHVQLEAKHAVQVTGAAELLGTLQQQVDTLSGAVKDVGLEREMVMAEREIAIAERDSIMVERKQLQEERIRLLAEHAEHIERINEVIQSSQKTVSRLEATNEALVIAVRNERKQWLAERAQLELRRTELIEAVHHEREQWASERMLLDAERVALEGQRDRLQAVQRELRIENELLAAEGARDKALVAEGEERRGALIARNSELEGNESRLSEAVRTLTRDMHVLSENNRQLNDEVLGLALKMEAVNRSLSWRFTRPLRVVANYFRSKLGRARSLN